MEAPFVSDIYLSQMLYGLTVRSPVAKGRLVSIECPQLPDNCTLLTAEDIPGENSLGDSALPILANGELSYIGEPVALLLGPDKDVLESYAADCKVIAEEGVPVFSAGDAATLAETSPGVVAARRDISAGEPEVAFANAASVVRSDYETGIQEHWYSEPCGAVAWMDLQEGSDEQDEPEDQTENAEPSSGAQTNDRLRLVVRTATQWPFHVRHSVARVLGAEAAVVQVTPSITGLHLDGKFWYPSLVSCHAALGTWITGKPVRVVLSKKEDFYFSPKRFGANINVASAFDENGELIGTEIEAAINVGAYGIDADEALDQVCLGSLGIYASKNISFKGTAFRTNIPPQGPFAGFALAQGFFAMERHISMIADGRRLDPLEWRKKNFLKTATLPAGLPIKDAIPGERLIGTATNMSDYSRKWASYELLRQKRKEQPPQDDSHQTSRETLRGIGIAIGYQGNGLLHTGIDRGNYGVELILEKDGSLEIKTGMTGVEHAVWKDIALDILGVDAENVRINRGGENSLGTKAPESGPAIMSRKTTALAEIIERACLAIRGQRFRDPLPISVMETAGPLETPEWSSRFPPPGEEEANIDCSGFLRPGSAAAVVEVEIDPIEYVPKIRGVWLAVDGGRIFREDKARKRLKLSTAQALGWAYREQIGYVSGRIPEGSFENFYIPGASEIPPVGIEFIRESEDSPVKQPKGIGDLPFACVPAAYLQAVSQAVDWHFRSIPLKAHDVWHADMTKRKGGGQ